MTDPTMSDFISVDELGRTATGSSGGDHDDQERSHSMQTCMTQDDALLAELSRQAAWQSEVKPNLRQWGDRVTGVNETAISKMRGSRAYTSPNGGQTRASVQLLENWIDQEKEATEGARGGKVLTCQQMKVTLNKLRIIESGSMSARTNGFQNMREVDEQSQEAPATPQPSVLNPTSVSRRSAFKGLLCM